MDDSYRGREAKLERAPPDRERIFRIMNPAAEHRVDIDMEECVVGQNLELFVQNLEAFLRDIVGHDVVDRDMHMVEPGVVQLLDPLWCKQVAIGDHAGDDSETADMRDETVELGMEQRFATAERDDGGAERRQVIQPSDH